MSDRTMPPLSPSSGQDQIRHLLQKIAALVARHLPTEDFYREYFGVLFGLPGIHAVLIQAAHGGTFSSVCGANEGVLTAEQSARQHVFLQSLVREAARRMEAISVAASAELDGHPGLRNESSLRLLAVPVIFGRSSNYDALQGVELHGIKDTAAGDQLDGLLRLLQACAAQTSPVLRHHRLEHVAKSSQQLVSTARLLSEISGDSDLESLAVTIVNRAREILGVDRCALLVSPRQGIYDVAAISNIPGPDKSSAMVRAMVQLAEDTARQGGPAVYRKASDKTEAVGTLADFFYYSRSAEVAAVPVKSRQQQQVGMLLAESGQIEGLTADRLETLAMLATQVGPSVSTALTFARTPMLGRLQSVAAWMEKPAADRRHHILRRYALPLGIAALLLLFPVRFDIGGDCRIAPVNRAAAVAEIGGRIVEVMVEDGQTVTAGVPLARIDDSMLRKEYDIYLQESARFEAEANRLRTEDERAASQVAELQMRGARRQAEIRRGLVEKSVIRSPIAGLVMSQGVLPKPGEVLATGAPFCVIGDPASWELTVLVPEKDVALLAAKLEKGSLPVRYLLEAFPSQTMTAVLAGPDVIAQMAEVHNNKNTFAVRFPVQPPEDALEAMRSGYSGRGKIEIGWRPLIYVWTRDFFNWLRTRWV
jgi:biotin carboxyl carrier protein